MVLANYGFDVVSGGYDHHNCAKRLNSSGIEFYNFGPLYKLKKSALEKLLYPVKIRKAVKRSDASIIHFFSLQPALLGAPVARLMAVNYVITVSGLGHHFVAKEKPNLIFLWMLKFAFEKAKCIFCLNEDDLYLLRDIVSTSVYRKIKLIPGEGVDTNYYKTDLANLQKADDVFRVVMVSRLIREKGVLEYINSVINLRCNFNDSAVEFHLIGDVDLNNPSSLSQQEVLDYVESSGLIWQGYVENVRDVLPQYDVMVLPSYREGLSVALLEGASAGLAMIASNVPGCREIVQHGVTGRLVEPRSVSQLTSAIEWYIKNPDLARKHGKNAISHVRDNFSDEIVHAAIIKTYDNIIRES